MGWTFAMFLTTVLTAHADIVVPGADGTDSAFNPTNANTVIDLNAAAIGLWNGANASPGNGVYDQEKWAVVFRFSSVNIPAGVTVRFINRADGNPPVVWLVSGSVTNNRIIDLSGEGGQGTFRQSIHGPGGFRGASLPDFLALRLRRLDMALAADPVVKMALFTAARLSLHSSDLCPRQLMAMGA